VLVVIGVFFLDLCYWYSNGDIPYKAYDEFSKAEIAWQKAAAYLGCKK
jgi:hypothetical protein